MICPLMSRIDDVMKFPDGIKVAIRELRTIECRQEQCALWIKYPNPDPEHTGKCGLIR